MRRRRGGVAGQHSWQQQVRRLQVDMEWERQKSVIAALIPYASPRLPRRVLVCFDEEQRQTRRPPRPAPHWSWRARLPHLFADPPTEPIIPAQRRPVPFVH